MSSSSDQAETTASPTTEAWVCFRDGEPYGMTIDVRPYRIRPAKRGDAIRPGDRYAVIRMSGGETRPATAVLDDPALAAIFERIARAIPGAAGTKAGLDPHTFLRTYAALLEEGAAVSLGTLRDPIMDAELD